MFLRNAKWLCCGLALLLLACGGNTAVSGAPTPTPPVTTAPAAEQVQEVVTLPDAPVPMTAGTGETPGGQKPLVVDAFFDEKAATGKDGAFIDASKTNLGYVAVLVTSDKKLKFQVIKKGEEGAEDITYTYDQRGDGVPSIYSIQSGDGDYTFRVMENVEGKKYASKYKTKVTVKLDNEFVPFLCTNDYARFTADSMCVKQANDLSRNTTDALGVVANIYEFINATVRYDYEKAKSVQSGYVPDPDKTLQSGKGICFDYASLAAAMLRSQGIPCKLIFGYVAPNNLYHAWNMFYTEESGWVTVSFKVSGKNWTRLDLTFTANGENDSFIGDGSNYTDEFYY